jgi:hypothetical protein
MNADLYFGALAASGHRKPYVVEHFGWGSKSSNNLFSVALKACG